MTAASKWILAIAGLLAANVVAMAALAVAANHGGAQVIPDYYTRATHYDDELARSSESRALGWRVDLALADRTLDATLSDAAGKPIDGARVRVTGYQRAHAADVVNVELAATANGRYRGAGPARAGRYDLVVDVEAGGAHYTQRVVAEAR